MWRKETATGAKGEAAIARMSFRIDDILKRGSRTPSPARAQQPSSTKCNVSCDSPTSPSETRHHEPWYNFGSSDTSILQQTLLNRGYPYYRTISECPSAKLYSSLYGCDKMYLPYGHLDPYVDKGKLFLVTLTSKVSIKTELNLDPINERFLENFVLETFRSRTTSPSGPSCLAKHIREQLELSTKRQ